MYPTVLAFVVGYGDGMATMQPDLVAWALGPDGTATPALLRLAAQQVDGDLGTWDRGWGLIDLDDLCRGPREFDLAPSLVSYQRFHRDRRRWQAFKDAYGEADWEAVSYLGVMRESTMNTWLAGLWTHSQPARDELAHRVRTWDQDPSVHERWSAL